MIQQLRGSTVLVTGASRGIGAVLAEHLAAEGVNLVLAARDANNLEAVRSRCAAHGIAVRPIAVDLAVPADRNLLVREAGEIDVLVNNAAIEANKALMDQTSDDIASQVAINLEAPIQLTRSLLGPMIAKRRGVIVNVSSMSGKAATPFNSVYAATKYGLNGFSASLRIELEGTGVHVGTVCPGFVGDTGMWANTGMRAPAMMREVQPEHVVRGSLAVMRGAPEVLVTPGPVRPLLLLRDMFPGIEGPILRRMGILDVMKKRTEVKRG